MSIKPTWSERERKAWSNKSEEPIAGKKDVKEVIEEISNIISCCLEEKGIDGDILCMEPQKIDYDEIKKIYKTNGRGHIIWLTFVDSGHVAVVGAGTDIGFSQNEKKGTWRVIHKLDVKWYDKKVIIIPVRGLDIKSNGLKNVSNILNCRNGVEHCIGEYLVGKKVSILNCYSHRNYSEKCWEECERSNYLL